MAVALDQNLFVLSQYGPVAPSTLAGPVRQGLGKYGDGLFVEEGTTNLVLNPRLATNATSWTFSGTSGRVTTMGRTGPGAARADFVAGAGGANPANVSFTATAGVPVTFSTWVYVPAALGSAGTIYCDVSGAGGFDSANFAVDQTLTGRWQVVKGTVTPTTTGTHFVRIVTDGGITTSGSVYMTDVQVEAKSYATSYCDGSLGNGYAWTGTANASSSTRATGVLKLPLGSTPAGPLTVACWYRPSRAPASGLYEVPLELGSTGTTTTPSLQFYNNSALLWSSSVDAAPSVAYTYTPGDLIFMCGVLGSDNKTFTAYFAVNGGALQNPSSGTSARTFTSDGTVSVGGTQSGAYQCNGVVEQVLVFNAALTSAEVAALAAGSNETSYVSDPRIVFAAGTGTVRGTVNAETPAGTGSYRADRSMKCYAEAIIPNAASPDDDGATLKITVPAGSGIGAGSTIAVGYPLQSYSYVVKRAASPGGVYDELYV